ncbi:BLOC-1-related complex subunit 7 isoform X2 [Capricornis sumatraensis]|uniref:BLOC-1-related complex subunit 7 isoform X2 n=1 Tax=Capricornis sumatraensis TaxID=34865 RepID=UPI0036052F12
MATGTPDSQARFGQSVKGLLTEKVNTCGTDVIALTKQVLKGSRSSEVFTQEKGKHVHRFVTETNHAHGVSSARSGSSKHGTPGRCHFTLRR